MLIKRSIGEWHHMWVRLKDGENLNFFNVESILDVGCGNGRYMTHFSRKSCLVVGIDINKDILIKTRNGKNLVVADAHFLPFRDSYFELVFSTDVIEHLINPLHALSEMYRVSKDRIYVCTPNKLCPVDMSKVASWLGNHKRPLIEKYLTKWELEKLLKIAGFKNPRIVTRSFIPFGWLIVHKRAKIPKQLIKRLIQIETLIENLPIIKDLAGVLIAYSRKLPC